MSRIHHVKSYPATDAPAWQEVEPILLQHYMWMNNGYEPRVEVKLCYTPQHLHLHYRTFEKSPTVRYFKTNDPVYTDSCVEFFVQPLPEKDERYLNFEWNAAGTLLLGLGKDRHQRQRLDVDPSALLQVQALRDQVDGEGEGEAYYWTLQFSIPFTWLRQLFPDFQPHPQTVLRANFYKCGDETPDKHYGSWNQVTSENPDFHRSCDFGKLILD